MMDWTQLLCRDRYGDGSHREDARSPFERDAGRILFSNAFRRLAAKTQVFPVPENDHVHSRLTHSLEVADVGRSLGKLVGAEIERRRELEPGSAEDIAHIVAAACLAHDLGNPPFGHAGEDAIGRFFEHGAGAAVLRDPAAIGATGALGERQAQELRHFEGNAQGFRLLTATTMYPGAGGMRLTAATLGAFTKYPQGAERRKKDKARPTSGKKFGYMDAEAKAFAWVAGRCGLEQAAPAAWCRHPLAFLMEAADDICYRLLDLEDGCALGLITRAEAVTLLAPILGVAEAELAERPIGQLRARAIGALVEQCVAVFLAAEEGMLAGTYECALCDEIPAAVELAAIYDLNMARCYRAPVVLGLEQAGFNVIDTLLTQLLESVRGTRNPHLRQLLPDDFEGRLPQLDAYRRLLALTDFVSGMTDRYAVRLYRQITGIDLHSV